MGGGGDWFFFCFGYKVSGDWLVFLFVGVVFLGNSFRGFIFGGIGIICF